MSQPNGSDRLDRIERILEEIATEHKMLLTAQVLLTGQMQRFGEKVEKLGDKVDRLADTVEAHVRDPNAHKS